VQLPDGMRVGAFALSGLIGLALGDTLFFQAIKAIGVQRASVIQCLAPPLAAVVSWILFDEKLGRWEWLGLMITTGALAWLIASRRPGPSAAVELDWSGVVAAVGSALCQASTVIILRQSLQGVDVITGTLLRVLPAILVLSVLSFRGGGWESMRQVFSTTRNGNLSGSASHVDRGQIRQGRSDNRHQQQLPGLDFTDRSFPAG
jgi:drug/metabolite transporter (DMT)-like permease